MFTIIFIIHIPWTSLLYSSHIYYYYIKNNKHFKCTTNTLSVAITWDRLGDGFSYSSVSVNKFYYIEKKYNLLNKKWLLMTLDSFLACYFNMVLSRNIIKWNIVLPDIPDHCHHPVSTFIYPKNAFVMKK